MNSDEIADKRLLRTVGYSTGYYKCPFIILDLDKRMRTLVQNQNI